MSASTNIRAPTQQELDAMWEYGQSENDDLDAERSYTVNSGYSYISGRSENDDRDRDISQRMNSRRF